MPNRCVSAHGTDERPYTRERDLPRLVPLWPHEIADMTYAGRIRVLAKLQRSLRIERQLGIAGHWNYDVARHRQLLVAYRNEAAALVRHDYAPAAPARHE